MATSHLHDKQLWKGIAAGTSIGAALLLLTVGILSLLEGISAIARDKLFVVGVNYVYQFDVRSWGWVHIAIGVVLILCSLGLVRGTPWGRFAAYIIASFSILANFLWLPYYPWWSVLMIALNVVVIWAIATWRPEN